MFINQRGLSHASCSKTPGNSGLKCLVAITASTTIGMNLRLSAVYRCIACSHILTHKKHFRCHHYNQRHTQKYPHHFLCTFMRVSDWQGRLISRGTHSLGRVFHHCRRGRLIGRDTHSQSYRRGWNGMYGTRRVTDTSFWLSEGGVKIGTVSLPFKSHPPPRTMADHMFFARTNTEREGLQRSHYLLLPRSRHGRRLK